MAEKRYRKPGDRLYKADGLNPPLPDQDQKIDYSEAAGPPAPDVTDDPALRQSPRATPDADQSIGTSKEGHVEKTPEGDTVVNWGETPDIAAGALETEERWKELSEDAKKQAREVEMRRGGAKRHP